MSIVWEDPPFAGVGQRTNWVEVLEPLMQSPGRWARVAEKDLPGTANSLANAMRRGAQEDRAKNNYVNVPPGQWEFVMRTVYDEANEPHYYVYARYLGEEEE